MALQIHDTMAREKRLFLPLLPGKVKMYVCGVTVYGYSHVGHARKEVAFDVVYRWLQHRGFEVTYVRNFTDVDDKIIKRANERGITSQALSQEFIDAFHEDMKKLGILEVTQEPRATENIPEMIGIVEQLMARGLAYENKGDVWFSVPSYPKYGRLSRRKLDEMRAGARVEVDESKRDPADFALWKSAKPGEPSWPSPWGEGRPGWHIECSAMVGKLLGATIDIHGGGEDLVFPHHENEIAQSEGSSGVELSHYWMHNAFVNMGTEKMSRSVGNVELIRDVLARYPGEVFRFFCLNAHYRTPINFTWEAMEKARQELEYFYGTLVEMRLAFPTHIKNATQRHGPVTKEVADLVELESGVRERFAEAMDDDFNTSVAVALLYDLARGIRRMADLPDMPTNGDEALARKLHFALRDLAAVLGLLNHDPEQMLKQLRTGGLASTGLSEADIEARIALREQAKAARDFKTADAIRAALKEKGITLEDVKGGKTTWRRS